MGKTFKRNSPFRPRKRGTVFVKDKFWKKHKPKPTEVIVDPIDPTTDIKVEIPE